MKKMTNVEVKLINLQATDILTSSPNNAVGGPQLVGARGYYDDEEEEW